MRQSGILAAGALYGLEHHRDDLARDHGRAQALARALDAVPGVRVVPPQTNIVMIDLAPPRTAAEVAQQARDAGVLIAVWTATRLRVVTHRDIDDQDIETVTSVLSEILTRHAAPRGER